VLVQRSYPARALRSASAPCSAFERGLLPSLARWFLERVDDCSPEYLIPVETKGARLLEAILEYAREQLRSTIDVPVIYSTALPYLEAGTLENARVMIVDDAWRTGNNLLRHRQRVERYGATEVDTVVCVGFPESESPDEENVWCFKRAPNDEQYRELLWQVAELVIARALPPEVDHHVYRLTVPQRSPVALATLEQALSLYGTVTIDAPANAAESIFGLTLHFPALPGVHKLPHEGPVREEGANKLRFFPDPDSGDIFVVPVSFPALDVEYCESGVVSEECAQAVLDTWPGKSAPLGQLLHERAIHSTPETLFRTVSACAELDLVRGLAEVLAGTYPQGSVRLEPAEELLQRLYGKQVGDAVTAQIKRELTDLLTTSAPQREPQSERPAGRRLTLDTQVAETTRQIAEGLVELCGSLGRALDRLEGASSALWQAEENDELKDAEEDAEAVAKAVAGVCTDVRRTLRAEPDPRPHAGDARAQLQAAARDLLEARDILASFAAALAGSYQGAKGRRAPSQLAPEREATVLFADITKSVERLVSDGFPVSAEWKNTGLNIAAQWAKAFGGAEIQDRPGDAIWLDFGQRPEAAVMCAAAIQ